MSVEKTADERVIAAVDALENLAELLLDEVAVPALWKAARRRC